MLLVEIREFGCVTMYGYTYETNIPYWSMRYYDGTDVNNLREMRKFGKR